MSNSHDRFRQSTIRNKGYAISVTTRQTAEDVSETEVRIETEDHVFLLDREYVEWRDASFQHDQWVRDMVRISALMDDGTIILSPEEGREIARILGQPCEVPSYRDEMKQRALDNGWQHDMVP
jgi:hypothetical protein